MFLSVSQAFSVKKRSKNERLLFWILKLPPPPLHEVVTLIVPFQKNYFKITIQNRVRNSVLGSREIISQEFTRDSFNGRVNVIISSSFSLNKIAFLLK